MTTATPSESIEPHAPRDPNARHFETAHLHADLKGRSVRGGAVTLGAQGVKFVLNLGSTVVLARLLTPADFGLIAMVTALTGFVAMFKDAGLSMATVQRDQVNHAQVSTLFWVNVALSLLLMCVVAALAPAVAWFYGEPELVWVTLAIAATFILGGLTPQHMAILKRQMRFTALAVKDIAAMAAGVTVAITLAALGFGYWALVAMPAASALTGVILAWSLTRWIPGLPRRGSGVRPMLAFGGNLTGFNFVNYFSRNADNVLIGWFWGAGALGLYSKAYGLLMLPITNLRAPLTAVAMPAMSRLQNDEKRYREYYRRMTGAMAFVSMPLAAVLFVTAEDAIVLVLGPQWAEAGVLFQALAAAAFIQPSASLRGLVLQSSGHGGRYLRLGIGVAIVTIAAFAIGVQWGALGVAVAYGVVNYLHLYPTLRYAFRYTPVRVRDYFESVALPAVASLVAVAVAIAVSTQLPPFDGRAIPTLITAALFGLTYVSVLLLLPGGYAEIRRYVDYSRQLVSRRAR